MRQGEDILHFTHLEAMKDVFAAHRLGHRHRVELSCDVRVVSAAGLAQKDGIPCGRR
jgi:hypothetical protein